MILIEEIRLETLSFSEDAVESKWISYEGFEGKMCFKSNACLCGHEFYEALSLNSLKVDSNLESFRWMNFD